MPQTLSIVIPSHCRPDLLARCLATVCRYMPAGTHVVVVDDGSTDGRVSRTAGLFPNVEVVRLGKPAGFCVAANTGIAAATGDIVELLNDDTEVTAAWAGPAMAHFEDSRVVAVAPLVLQADPDGRALGRQPVVDSAGDDYDRGGFARKRFHGRPVTDVPVMAGPVWGASATAAFYRRSALLNAGGFPADFGAYFEDVDLSFRLQTHGGEIRFEPASVVWHRVSSSYGRRPGRKTVERQSCNEERVFWRNIGWRGLPRHAAVVAAKAVRRWDDGTFIPWATGRVRAWCGC